MKISATGEVLLPCALCSNLTAEEHRCNSCGAIICEGCDRNHNLPMAHVTIAHRASAAEAAVIGN